MLGRQYFPSPETRDVITSRSATALMISVRHLVVVRILHHSGAAILNRLLKALQAKNKTCKHGSTRVRHEAAISGKELPTVLSGKSNSIMQRAVLTRQEILKL